MPIKYRADRDKWQADCRQWNEGRPLFQSKREAQEFERACRMGNIEAKEKSIALEVCFKAYAGDVSENKSSRTTRLNETRYFNLKFHFLTGRGISRLGDVELKDLQALQQWLLKPQQLGEEKKESWSKSTVNRAFHTYKHFWGTMVKWKYRSTDPCKGLEMFAEDEAPIEVVEPTAFNEALEKASWFAPVLKFIHEVGCRPSSIERMIWADVDFKKREFVLTTKKGRDAQMKRIPHAMTDSIFALLIKLRNERSALGASEPVFRNFKGKPITAAWISKKGGKVFGHKVLGGAMKALRHTLASDLTAAGIPTEIVRQALDHSNIRTTQRYAKSIKGNVIAGAIERVRSGLSVAPNGTNSEKVVAAGDTKEIG